MIVDDVNDNHEVEDKDHYHEDDNDYLLIIIIYYIGDRKDYLVEQREYMLEKYYLTKDMLAECYKGHLRLSIYKQLMRQYLNKLNFKKDFD